MVVGVLLFRFSCWMFDLLWILCSFALLCCLFDVCCYLGFGFVFSILVTFDGCLFGYSCFEFKVLCCV